MTALKIETKHIKCNCTPRIRVPHCHLCSVIAEVRIPWEFCVTQRSSHESLTADLSKDAILTVKE